MGKTPSTPEYPPYVQTSAERALWDRFEETQREKFIALMMHGYRDRVRIADIVKNEGEK